ncbi:MULTISPECIES: hypothetical protein [Streptomyces]|uniref:hypothetical protein n=1 Tax=Streptomyces rochei TaxID=1928 RepID=UPI0004C7D349
MGAVSPVPAPVREPLPGPVPGEGESSRAVGRSLRGAERWTGVLDARVRSGAGVARPTVPEGREVGYVEGVVGTPEVVPLP